MSTVGRNDPCHCGSGKKYKKCCEEKDQRQQHQVLEKQWAQAEKALPKDQPDAAATSGGHAPHGGRKPDPSRGGAPQRHQPFVAPKMNMPRKSGGG